MAMNMKTLTNAAKDINKVCKPKPELPVKPGTKKEDLVEELTSAAEQYADPEDTDFIDDEMAGKLKKETITVLEELSKNGEGEEGEEGAEEEEEESEEEESEEEESEEEESEEEESEEEESEEEESEEEEGKGEEESDTDEGGNKSASPKKGKKGGEKSGKAQQSNKSGSGKKKGIISTIVEILKDKGSRKKGVSKDEIVEALKEQFPDREEKSMRNTVNVQVPNRINKERDFTVEKLENGNYAVKES